MAIFRPKTWSKTSILRIHLSRYLDKYQEFLHLLKSSEISATSSIRIKQLVKRVSVRPPLYTLIKCTWILDFQQFGVQLIEFLIHTLVPILPENTNFWPKFVKGYLQGYNIAYVHANDYFQILFEDFHINANNLLIFQLPECNYTIIVLCQSVCSSTAISRNRQGLES